MSRPKGSKNKPKNEATLSIENKINSEPKKRGRPKGSTDRKIFNTDVVQEELSVFSRQRTIKKKFNCPDCNTEIKVFSDCLKEKDIVCHCKSSNFNFEGVK